MSILISRRFLTAVAMAAVLLCAVGGQRAAASDEPAIAFIQSLGDQAVDVLRDKADSTFEEREAAFREVMVMGFDIPTVSRFVMGRYWKTASEQQRADYRAIFVDFIVRVYASRFDSYGGEQFVVHSVINDESGDKIVRAEVMRPSGGDPINIDFRVRTKDDVQKVIDVSVEGISMLHTHRVEFASVISRKGIDGLLDDLRARIEAPVGEAAE